ncbi:hypothetical protein [Rheinheimera sp. EpRS3]|uniref:hypothetical protein n=1 Tax=Rheinheimera sp. EpRS3 TaxID=1712383 RepID=UPI000B2D8212|nr:hypothetical protein [Rheinheimera sp. EpRS3]
MQLSAEQQPEHSKPTVAGQDGRIEPTGKYLRRVGVSVPVDAILNTAFIYRHFLPFLP